MSSTFDPYENEFVNPEQFNLLDVGDQVWARRDTGCEFVPAVVLNVTPGHGAILVTPDERHLIVVADPGCISFDPSSSGKRSSDQQNSSCKRKR